MEKERLKDPKHRAHEAMSRACKRFCPHCNQEYMKSDGCNKIRCKCKKLSCYICGEQIEDYSHFCNHKLPPGSTTCACGKSCRLWTSTEEMEQLDRKRRQEAGRKVLADQGITDEREILAILATPRKKAASASTARVANAAPPVDAVAQRPVNHGYPRPRTPPPAQLRGLNRVAQPPVNHNVPGELIANVARQQAQPPQHADQNNPPAAQNKIPGHPNELVAQNWLRMPLTWLVNVLRH